MTDPARRRTDKTYVVGTHEFQYPGAGDALPPGGAKVHLLTVGGICVDGQWRDGQGFLGWAPLPRRNKEKEKAIGIV